MKTNISWLNMMKNNFNNLINSIKTLKISLSNINKKTIFSNKTRMFKG